MHRVAWILVPLSACAVFPDDPDPIVEHACETYTGKIFEPTDGATVSGVVSVRMRWNASEVPDRYISMRDDFSHYFIGGATEVHGDGSESLAFPELPPGGTFTFEMGWICDAGNGGPSVPLATVRFHTAP